MLKTDPGMAGFGLARLDGQLVLVSQLPEGSPLPNLKNTNSNRLSFERALAAKKLRLGPPYFMKALNEWVIPIRVPVSATLDDEKHFKAMMTAGYKITGSHAGWSDLLLPQYVKIKIVRHDAYVQYQFPIDTDYQSVYGNKIPNIIQKKVLKSSLSSGSFVATAESLSSDYLFYFSKIPEYELYTLSTIPVAEIYSHFLSRLILPALFFLGICMAGVVVFLRTYRTQKHYENNLIHQATHDALTNLPNRLYLVDYLAKALLQAEKNNTKLAVLFLDLDFFKKVNDSFGHEVGDKLLKAVGDRLLSLFPEADLVARQGGMSLLL